MSNGCESKSGCSCGGSEWCPSKSTAFLKAQSHVIEALDTLESQLRKRLDELEERQDVAISKLAETHKKQLDWWGDRILSTGGVSEPHWMSAERVNQPELSESSPGVASGPFPPNFTLTSQAVSLMEGLSNMGMPSEEPPDPNDNQLDGEDDNLNRCSMAFISEEAEAARARRCSLQSVQSTMTAPARFHKKRAMEEDMLEVANMAGRSSILKFSSHRPSADHFDAARASSSNGRPTLWELFKRMVRSQIFDIVCGIPILAFAMLLGLETNHMSQNEGNSNSMFKKMHVCFNIWSVTELMIRGAGLGKDFVVGEDRFWNLLDVFMVVTSVIDVIFWIAVNEKAVRSAGMVRTLKGVRMLRLVKTCRIARMLRYVHEFKKMVFSLQASIMTLFWCVTVIFALVYIFAILFTQGAMEHLTKVYGDDPSYADKASELRHFYGSLPKSIFSLYISMSGGMSWEAVVRPLMPVHWTLTVLFLIFITFSIFGLLNVLTSVFVESTIKSAQHYKELVIQESQSKKETAISHLRNLFRQMDVDGNGELDQKEMRKYLAEDCDCIGYLEACDISINDVSVLFRLLDSDDSGTVSLDEFCEGCLTLKGEARSYDIHCLIYENNRFLSKWSSFSRALFDRMRHLDVTMSEVGNACTSLQKNMKAQAEVVSMLLNAVQHTLVALDRLQVAPTTLTKTDLDPQLAPTKAVEVSPEAFVVAEAVDGIAEAVDGIAEAVDDGGISLDDVAIECIPSVMVQVDPFLSAVAVRRKGRTKLSL
eukprot:TRINITY_DN12275_c0_g1_i1.p1 TRINITY_DN12275_c0_g1~~TRINITY_DN12275_c0_g1_i1.p1  ORF type:complete len:787 (+),score=149.71 TRINITY_DN12275_c0_g1_i1:67-2361(+)